MYQPQLIQKMADKGFQQLAKVNVSEVPVTSTRINVSETVRDLGVVTQSAVAVRTGGRRVSQWLLPATATPTTCQIYVSRGRKDAGPDVHFVSPGLLQLAVLRHRRCSDEPAAVCPECGCTFGVGSHRGARRYDHITPVLQELHWLPVRRRVEFKLATLDYLSLSGMAPACQLVSDEGRRLLRSATSRTCVVRRTTATMETGVLRLQVLDFGTSF